MTILFFLWGFAYGLLDGENSATFTLAARSDVPWLPVLNSHFQKELNLSASMASGLSAYVSPPPPHDQSDKMAKRAEPISVPTSSARSPSRAGFCAGSATA